jgi:hypothetical protein
VSYRHPMHRCALRFHRTADAAFRTPTYAQGWEPHIPPPLWSRIVLFFKRNFA